MLALLSGCSHRAEAAELVRLGIRALLGEEQLPLDRIDRFEFAHRGEELPLETRLVALHDIIQAHIRSHTDWLERRGLPSAGPKLRGIANKAEALRKQIQSAFREDFAALTDSTVRDALLRWTARKPSRGEVGTVGAAARIILSVEAWNYSDEPDAKWPRQRLLQDIQKALARRTGRRELGNLA